MKQIEISSHSFKSKDLKTKKSFLEKNELHMSIEESSIGSLEFF